MILAVKSAAIHLMHVVEEMRTTRNRNIRKKMQNGCLRVNDNSFSDAKYFSYIILRLHRDFQVFSRDSFRVAL